MIELLLFAGLAAAAVWAATEGRRRWLIHQLRQAAAHHDFVADPTRRPLPRRFDIPGAASGSTADLTVTDPRSGATAFRHRSRSRNGNEVHEHLHVLVPLPFNAPHVLLRRPSIVNRLGSRLGLEDTELADHQLTRQLGLVDVQVGHEGFDQRWQVATDDERFARRLVAGRTAGELIRRAEFQGSPLNYEFFGPWVLVSGPDYSIDGSMLLLGWLARFADLLPTDLTADHPPPTEPVSPWG